MRKLMIKHEPTFPFAVHEGSSAVWHLYPVLKWLQEKAHYAVPQPLLDVAVVNVKAVVSMIGSVCWGAGSLHLPCKGPYCERRLVVIGSTRSQNGPMQTFACGARWPLRGIFSHSAVEQIPCLRWLKIGVCIKYI